MATSILIVLVSVHILTREVYQLLLGVISSASRQIRQLSAELEHAKEMRDTYKLTIDSLRKTED